MGPLPRDFYAQDTRVVAKQLLGKLLVRQTPYGKISAKIVENEAYRGCDDPASHAYRGRTKRNQLMFGKAGMAYIYFIYGNYYCLNVVTESEGTPGAVLIRAVEILQGVALARKYRKAASPIRLTNGPGKLTQALNITKAQNGLDLTTSEELFISPPKTGYVFKTVTTKRIGIKRGREKPWRFYVEGSKYVSKP